jgi:hypothetical protein
MELSFLRLEGLKACLFGHFSHFTAGALAAPCGAADETAAGHHIGAVSGPGVVSFRWACIPVDVQLSPLRRYKRFPLLIVQKKALVSLRFKKLNCYLKVNSLFHNLLLPLEFETNK